MHRTGDCQDAFGVCLFCSLGTKSLHGFPPPFRQGASVTASMHRSTTRSRASPVSASISTCPNNCPTSRVSPTTMLRRQRHITRYLPEQTCPPYPSAGNRCEMRVLFQTLNPTVSPICAIKSACKSLSGVAPPGARTPQKLHRSCCSTVGGRRARSTIASLSSIRLLPRKCSATSSKWTTTALPDLFLLIIATRRRYTRSNLVLKARCALKPRLLVPPLAELTATTR